MSLLTPARIDELRTQLFTDFMDAYSATEVWWPQLATRVPSSSKQNDYGWMAKLPKPREWQGSRIVHNIAEHSYELPNRTFELTIGVGREELEDDQIVSASMAAGAGGESYRKYPDDRIAVELLQAGHSTLCFDGQNFYDTDHPVNGRDASDGTYSNYAASGMALDQTNFLARRAAMMSRTDEGGRPLGVRPSILQVPPALEGTAKLILEAERTANGSTNITRGMATVMVTEELAGQDTTWYLHDTRRRIKPFVRQVRRPVQMVLKNRVDDDIVLIENEVRFYWDSREAYGFTLPFLSDKNVQ